MKTNTLGFSAVCCLALLSTPATLRAQNWLWASAPTAITGPGGTADPDGSAISATALDAFAAAHPDRVAPGAGTG